jgi:hypothetical protein
MDNTTRINKDLELFSLKIKLVSTLKCYLNNTSQSEIKFFDKILDLLKQKYTDTDDFNFLEQGIRNNLQNYHNNLPRAITVISSYIYNYNNGYLLNDLLNSIDTGIIYRLEYRHDNLEKLIIENTGITLETENDVGCLR